MYLIPQMSEGENAGITYLLVGSEYCHDEEIQRAAWKSASADDTTSCVDFNHTSSNSVGILAHAQCPIDTWCDASSLHSFSSAMMIFDTDSEKGLASNDIK